MVSLLRSLCVFYVPLFLFTFVSLLSFFLCYLCFSVTFVSMFLCSSVSLYLGLFISMFLCFSVPLFLLVSLFRCFFFSLFLCFRVQQKGVQLKILDFLAFEICCSSTFLVSKMGSFVSQLQTAGERGGLLTLRKLGSKNTQISLKWTKSGNHLMLLQKVYARSLKIFIFWQMRHAEG